MCGLAVSESSATHSLRCATSYGQVSLVLTSSLVEASTVDSQCISITVKGSYEAEWTSTKSALAGYLVRMVVPNNKAWS